MGIALLLAGVGGFGSLDHFNGSGGMGFSSQASMDLRGGGLDFDSGFDRHLLVERGEAPLALGEGLIASDS